MAHTQVSLRGQRASFWAGEFWGTCGGNGLLGDLHSLVCSSCHMTGGLHKSQGNPGWVETFHWVLRNKHFFVWQLAFHTLIYGEDLSGAWREWKATSADGSAGGWEIESRLMGERRWLCWALDSSALGLNQFSTTLSIDWSCNDLPPGVTSGGAMGRLHDPREEPQEQARSLWRIAV